MSWVMIFELDPNEEGLLILIFFFISFRFPKGKLGDGPCNPFFLNFLYASIGKTQQEKNNLQHMYNRIMMMMMMKSPMVNYEAVSLSLSLSTHYQ